MTSASSDTRPALSEEAAANNLIGLSRSPAGESSLTHGSSGNSGRDQLANYQSASSVGTESQAEYTPSREETTLNTPASGVPARPACTCMTPVGKDDIVPVESDETLLSIYRNQLSGRFPFVIIPAGVTPRQLHAARPLLMKVIRMVASVRHLRLMRGQSRAVMEHIANAMLMRSERSLDLLQGILVFLGSYHYHCMAHAQFQNLIRLAISLVEDIHLNMSPTSQQRSCQPPSEESATRTNEEKRALLGVWYMSSK